MGAIVRRMGALCVLVLLAGEIRVAAQNTTTRVSVTNGGAQANAGSFEASLSDDGRYVVFSSGATNLVPGDTNALGDIFVRDRQLGTTERVNLRNGGAEAMGGSSFNSSISADGEFILFASFASNLVAERHECRSRSLRAQPADEYYDPRERGQRRGPSGWREFHRGCHDTRRSLHRVLVARHQLGHR